MPEKTEGAKQNCGKCKTPLVCVKIVSEWQGKKSEKLQWQNVADSKAHFKFISAGNYGCNVPEEIGQTAGAGLKDSKTIQTPSVTPSVTTNLTGSTITDTTYSADNSGSGFSNTRLSVSDRELLENIFRMTVDILSNLHGIVSDLNERITELEKK